MEQNETIGVPAVITPSDENIEQAAIFISGLAAQMEQGRHILTISTASDVIQIHIAKDASNEVVLDASNHHKLYESMLVALERDHVFGATLRSFTGAANPTAHSELRGWVVTSFSIRPLTADEVIEAYCTDHATGKIKSPERDVAYREGWNLDD